jgi:phage-related protein
MSDSIFSIQVHDPNQSYNIYDIVRVGGQETYYYALQNVPVGKSLVDPWWGGVLTYQAATRPHFVWKASYNSTINNTPRTKFTQFGDGYEQRYPDGIHNTLLSFDLTFEFRTNAEAAAISHFLYTRKGVESFFYTPPSPYNAIKIFICKEFTHTPVFFNNNLIRARFEERVN